MTYKVLKVNMIDGTATVGNDVSETMEDYPLSDFNYTPNTGDEVKLYKNGAKVLIVLASENMDEQPMEQVSPAGSHSMKVNRIVYALLAILVGDFGIHHFYAGDNARGVKYLLLSLLLSWTFVVPFVIWIKCIIQAVSVLNMPADQDGNVTLYYN